MKSCIARYRAMVGVSENQFATILRQFWPRTIGRLLLEPPAVDRSKSALGVTIREPPSTFRCYDNVDHLPLRRKAKAETSAGSDDVEEQSVKTDRSNQPDQGVLASDACSLFMKSYGPRGWHAQIYYDQSIT